MDVSVGRASALVPFRAQLQTLVERTYADPEHVIDTAIARASNAVLVRDSTGDISAVQFFNGSTDPHYVGLLAATSSQTARAVVTPLAATGARFWAFTGNPLAVSLYRRAFEVYPDADGVLPKWAKSVVTRLLAETAELRDAARDEHLCILRGFWPCAYTETNQRRLQRVIDRRRSFIHRARLRLANGDRALFVLGPR